MTNLKVPDPGWLVDKLAAHREWYYSPGDHAEARFVATEMDFSRINWAGIDLAGTVFLDCSLADADLTGANLARAILYRCSLEGTRLVGADLYKAEADDACAVGADFTGTRLLRTSLWGVDLRGSKFSNASMIRTQLHGSDLRGTTWTGAILDRTMAGESRWGDWTVEGMSGTIAFFDPAVLHDPTGGERAVSGEELVAILNADGAHLTLYEPASPPG